MKSNKIITLILFIFFCLLEESVQSQIQWQRALGGSGEEFMDGDKLIKQTPDGGYIIAGTTNSGDGDVTFIHTAYEFWLVKLSVFGNIQWEKTYGGSNSEQCRSICLASDGGYVLVGESYLSNDGDVSGNQGLMDFWVVKIDSMGNLQWQKTLGGSNFESANAVDEANDGGFYIAGFTNSNDGNITGYHGGTDGWLVKLNSSGNLLWEKAIGGSNSDEISSISSTTDGGCILGGTTYSNDDDVSGNNGLSDLWLVKFDSIGSLQWQKCLGGSSNENAGIQGASVLQTSDNGFVIAGTTTSNNGDVTGYHGMGDIWVVKTDSTGLFQWERAIGGSDGERLSSIAQTNDGGFVILGDTWSTDGDISITNYGTWLDYFIIKINNLSVPVWQVHLGGSDSDIGGAIIQTADSGYLVGGKSMSNDYDVIANHGNWDIWVAKLSLTTGIEDANESNGISISPNPNNGKFKLSINNTIIGEKYKVSIFGVLGNLIQQTELDSNSDFDISNQTKGIYFVKVETSEKIYVKKIVTQ